jgi:hypothetical protein
MKYQNWTTTDKVAIKISCLLKNNRIGNGENYGFAQTTVLQQTYIN